MDQVLFGLKLVLPTAQGLFVYPTPKKTFWEFLKDPALGSLHHHYRREARTPKSPQECCF